MGGGREGSKELYNYKNSLELLAPGAHGQRPYDTRAPSPQSGPGAPVAQLVRASCLYFQYAKVTRKSRVQSSPGALFMIYS